MQQEKSKKTSLFKTKTCPLCKKEHTDILNVCKKCTTALTKKKESKE